MTLVPIAMVLGFIVMTIPFLATRRSPFLFGIRRTTLLFGAYMLVVSAIIWLDISLGLAPAIPWLPEISLLMAALPPCLLILNIAGRPQARHGQDEFDNQTPPG